ncbi:MAG: hypothetical protein MJZ70_02620 [Bacteroidales bacterium]|nr:hypothetical protein [Bacteroidales bacterium]
MRNPIFAIFMAALCLFSSVWAQTLTPIQTEVTRFAFADSYVTDVLDGSDGNHYLYRYYYDRSSGQKYDRLGTVNAERGTFSETNWSYPDEFSYITCFENEEGVIVYYEYYDNKEKVFTLYSNTISSGKANWHPEAIASFGYEKRDNIQYACAVSPDKQMTAICMQQSQRSGQFKGSMVFVLDNQGKLLWQKEVELQMSNENFGSIGIEVDNDGRVYAAYYSYDDAAHKQRDHEVLSIYEISEGETQLREKNIGFSIASATMTLGEKGMLHIGGYSLTDVKKNADGTFLVEYDVRSSEFASVNQLDFSGYNEGIVGGILVGYYANQDYLIAPKAIYEYSDGTVGLLGEQVQITRVYEQSGVRYYYFVKNIILTRSDAQGAIDQVNMYERKAISYSFTPIISYPYFKDDQIYLLFNDNTANYSGGKNQTLKFYKVGMTKADLVMMTIDKQGVENRRVIYHGQQAKNCVVRPFFMEEDGFSVLSTGKKYADISKLKVEDL